MHLPRATIPGLTLGCVAWQAGRIVAQRGAPGAGPHQNDYEFLPQCIKDWSTLANSAHQDRIKRPGNVEMVIPK